MKWSHLPNAGGLYDQHPDLLDGFRIIFQARAKHEEAEAKKRENENRKSQSQARRSSSRSSGRRPRR